MNYIQEYLCEAVDIIVEKRLSSANFNKAIEGTILSCEDTVIGKYKVKYQDSIFYAYAANPNIVYTTDALVNILVLGNDMSRDKIIISSIDKKITNYAPTLDEEDKYETIGSNVITSQTGAIELCSYDTKSQNVSNYFAIDESTLKASLSVGGYLKIKLKVRTELTPNQQAQGDYGIIFKLVFLDSKGNEQTPKEYKFSTRNITGNPYSLETAQEQIVYYKVENNTRFDHIDSIYAYVENFPDQREDFPDATDEDFPMDIFLSDVEMYGAKPLTEEELTGVYVSLLTPQGYIFTDSSTEDKTIVADVKVNGSATTREIEYYWFKENVNVMSSSDNGYNMLAGSGWECLNTKSGSEWLSGSNSITVTINDVAAKQVQYKCIIKFVDEENTTYEQTITMENVASAYRIEIISESGYNFWFGNGNTILTCKAYKNNESISFTSDYRFIWKRIEVDGGTYYYDSANEDIVFDNNVQGWYKNNKYRISINPAAIVSRNDYYCYVYNGDTFLGYGKTSLTNTTEQTSSDFSILMQNAQQTFIYDKNNLSPIHSTKQHKISLPTLSFILYDNEGQSISASKIIDEGGKIQWKIPYENTMLIADVDSGNVGSDTVNKFDIYERDTFDYSITDNYNYNCINNNIILEVTYQDLIIKAQTNFVFTKDKDRGTDGTDSILSSAPNYGGNTLISYYAAGDNLNNVYYKENENDIFYTASAKIYNIQVGLFTPQFWKGSKLIDIDTSSVVWSVLKDSNKSSFSLGDDTDNLIAFTLRNKDDNYDLYNNILRASLNYNGKQYFHEIPMITVNMHNLGYQLVLKQNTGFQFVEYDRKGYNPSYDSTYPFEILIGEGSLEEGFETVIDLSDYTCTWSYTSGLTEITENGVAINQKRIVPNDIYGGDTYNEAVFVQVYHSGVLIGDIHIPIYMYLDRVNAEDIDNWDGNRILNGDEVILSPTGYGSGNPFTGVFFGKVKTENTLEKGLFLYNNGTRILEATAAGSFILGAVKNNNGYININPTTGIQLYGGTYKANTSGLLIDLATPKIEYGNGKFKIDENGVIQALTLGSSIQIAGDNLKDVLAKYTLLSVYNQKMSELDSSIQTINQSISTNTQGIADNKKNIETNAQSIVSLRQYADDTFVTKTSFNNLNSTVTTQGESINSLNSTIESHTQSITSIDTRVKTIEENYITKDYFTTTINEYAKTSEVNKQLESYVTTDALAGKNYLTSESLKDYCLTTDLIKLDNAVAALLGLSGDTCVDTETLVIAPTIEGGSILIEDAFEVSTKGILTAKNADLMVNTLIYENPEDSTDTLDLIEEIKALRDEVEALKEQLETINPTT